MLNLLCRGILTRPPAPIESDWLAVNTGITYAAPGSRGLWAFLDLDLCQDHPDLAAVGRRYARAWVRMLVSPRCAYNWRQPHEIGDQFEQRLWGCNWDVEVIDPKGGTTVAALRWWLRYLPGYRPITAWGMDHFPDGPRWEKERADLAALVAEHKGATLTRMPPTLGQ